MMTEHQESNQDGDALVVGFCLADDHYACIVEFPEQSGIEPLFFGSLFADAAVDDARFTGWMMTMCGLVEDWLIERGWPITNKRLVILRDDDGRISKARSGLDN